MTTTIQPSPYATRVPGEPTTVDRHDPVVWGSADDGPLDEATLGRFEQDGYLPVEHLVGPADVDRLCEEVQRLVDTAPAGDERVVRERDSGAVRSLFEVHRTSEVFAELAADPRLADVARQLLGSDVYVHQSRLNLKPGFRGREFYWHSDFETWHAEDGMPRMRAVSLSLALSANHTFNGSLLVIPGSHERFVGCRGETPDEHYRESLKAQRYGVPDEGALAELVELRGIETVTGPVGSGVWFDCNLMHGSNGNITPLPRTNVFLVYNSVENALGDPVAAPAPRPTFIAARDVEPLPRTGP